MWKAQYSGTPIRVTRGVAATVSGGSRPRARQYPHSMTFAAAPPIKLPTRRPITYTPAQYSFPKGEHFKHSDLKWVDYEGLVSFPVEDPVLAQRLRDECGRFFVKLKAASFGRCDLRVDKDGTPYMLEINANCGVCYPPADYGAADICLSLDPAGHEGFTRQLVAAAFARHARRSAHKKT